MNGKSTDQNTYGVLRRFGWDAAVDGKDEDLDEEDDDVAALEEDDEEDEEADVEEEADSNAS